MRLDEVGIIGFGSSAYERPAARDEFGYLWDAAAAALTSAGLSPRDIDGLAISSTTLGGDNAVTAAEHMGLPLCWARGSVAGGAGALTLVKMALDAVRAGDARAVLCLAGARQSSAFFRSRVAAFNRAVGDYLAPHGIGGMNGLFGLIQRKHMETYGTTREALGRIATGQRASAALTERALLKAPMTIEDYLAAPMIADPLGLYDCVMPCSGAEAVVVAALDRVPSGKGVRVLAACEAYNHPPGEPVPLSGGWALFRDRFYETAGHGPDACQLVQCYDDYPIMVAIQLEDLGFCAKGEVGPFLAAREMQWNGSFPVNTSGGQLSCGQAGGGGGMIGLVEAVEQLRHEAGPRQVDRARHCVVSGYGMVAYGHGLAASAVYLEGTHD